MCGEMVRDKGGNSLICSRLLFFMTTKSGFWGDGWWKDFSVEELAGNRQSKSERRPARQAREGKHNPEPALMLSAANGRCYEDSLSSLDSILPPVLSRQLEATGCGCFHSSLPSLFPANILYLKLTA